MRRRSIKLTILFLVGLLIVIFPLVTDYLYDKRINNLELNYDKYTDELINEDNRISDLNNLLTSENNKLFTSGQKTFLNHDISFEKTLINLANYGLDDNVIGFIEIPSIDLKLPIYLGASNYNMQYGAVHLTGTSYPIGGINTNSVIAAHRGYYKTAMFRHIDRINIGDKLYIKNFNGNLEYVAVKKDVIYPTSLDKLTIQEGKDMITIMSCHPFPTNRQRYVVYFERV